MSFLEAIILGIIQGLTEFLPVSSSGHLELGKVILGSVPEEGMLMTVVLHFATALSTIVIFRKDIAEIFGGLFRFKNNEQLRFSILIIVSMIPAAIVGMLFEDQIDAFFGGNLLLVGLMLLLTGGLLFLADQAKSTEGKVTPVRAIIVGIAQAIAILPGISRSGATIGTSVLLGIDRTRAARFSFLMVVPLILGAMAVKTKDYLEIRSLENDDAAGRTAVIVEELEKDIDLNYTDDKAIYFAVLSKEQKWDRCELDKELLKQNPTIETESYTADLKAANLSDAQLEEVLNHDFGKIRTHVKTSKGALIGGFLAAFLVGLFACTWMIQLVKRSKLKYFAYYCFVVGLGAIAWTFIA